MNSFGEYKCSSEWSRIINQITKSIGLQNFRHRYTFGPDHVSIILLRPKIINLPKSDIYDIKQYFCGSKSIIKITCDHNVMKMDLEFFNIH